MATLSLSSADLSRIAALHETNRLLNLKLTQLEAQTHRLEDSSQTQVKALRRVVEVQASQLEAALTRHRLLKADLQTSQASCRQVRIQYASALVELQVAHLYRDRLEREASRRSNQPVNQASVIIDDNISPELTEGMVSDLEEEVVQGLFYVHFSRKVHDRKRGLSRRLLDVPNMKESNKRGNWRRWEARLCMAAIVVFIITCIVG